MKIGDLVKWVPYNVIGLIIDSRWVCMDSSTYTMQYFELLCVDSNGFSGSASVFEEEIEVINEH